MPKIKLNDLDYGGSPTVEDADHLMVADTRNQTLSAQNIITNILGDMAQLETAATASKAYAKGEYLVLGSYFYKATADIAQGDTLVAGTNIEQTNVGAEMKDYSFTTEVSGTTEANGFIRTPFISGYKIISAYAITPSNGYCVLPAKDTASSKWVLFIIGFNNATPSLSYANQTAKILCHWVKE